MATFAPAKGNTCRLAHDLVVFIQNPTGDCAEDLACVAAPQHRQPSAEPMSGYLDALRVDSLA